MARPRGHARAAGTLKSTCWSSAADTGLEFAQVFTGFGSQGDDRTAREAALPREDVDAAAIREVLAAREGIEIWLGERARRTRDGIAGHRGSAGPPRTASEGSRFAPVASDRAHAQHRLY